MTAIAATLQAFFTERLISQRRASPHTISSYRDTLRLLVSFAATRTGTPPCRLDIADRRRRHPQRRRRRARRLAPWPTCTICAGVASPEQTDIA